MIKKNAQKTFKEASMCFGYVNAIAEHICPEDGTVGLIHINEKSIASF